MKKIITFLFIAFSIPAIAVETITIPSKDGLSITADLYVVNDSLPYMLLCHQAGSSRGEYKNTAKRFSKLGYNCMAIDQRSGDSINGVMNQTAMEAKKKGKSMDYLDAEQDIVAALDYLYQKSGSQQVVLVGSSYSASLVLKIACGNPKVSMVVAFSPGEYFKKMSLKKEVAKLDKPVWVGSSAEEKPACEELMKVTITAEKTIFAPTEKGEHGSSALWKSNPNYLDYWMSLMMFFDND